MDLLVEKKRIRTELKNPSCWDVRKLEFAGMIDSENEFMQEGDIYEK